MQELLFLLIAYTEALNVMRKKILGFLLLLPTLLLGQVNTDRVQRIALNALYYEDYVLSIQYLNQVVNAKPYLHMPYFYRAIAKLNLEDYIGAEQDCDLVLDRNPFFIGAYQVRGISRINRGNYEGAIEDYQKVLSYDPEDVGALNNLSLSYINQKKYDEAVEILESLNRVSPKYTMAYLMRADVALRQQDTISSLNYIKKAIDIDKYDPNLWGAKGTINLFQNRYQEAESDLTEAIYLSGKDANHFVQRALARFHQNNLRGAMSDYDLALNVEPNNFYGHYNRGLLRARVGEYNKALEDFDFVLDVDPDNMMATFNRGLLRNHTGDFKGAETDFSRIISVYKDFYPAYYYRYDVRKKMGNMVGANQDEITMLKMQMDQSNTQKNNTNREKVEETRKRSDKNMENYRRLVVADNTEITREYNSEYRGKIQNKKVSVKSEPYFTFSYYEKKDDIRQTIHNHRFIDLLNSKKILPSPLLITNRDKALTLDEVNRYFELIDIHTSQIQKDEQNALLWFARALDFLLVQDIENAIKDLTEAIAVDNTFYPAYFLRSIAKLKQIEYIHSEESSSDGKDLAKTKKVAAMEYESVFRDLERVIELAPDFAYAYFNKARLSFELKDYPAALTNYSKAIELDPKFAEAYFNRGLIYIFLGNNNKGVSDLSIAGQMGIVESYNIIKRFSDTGK